MRDLKDGPKRGLHWRPERAARNLGFFPAVLSITAGAKEGQPFTLLPWHTFSVGSLFGWYKDSGRLRFRKGWLETGKGQAKALALDTPVPTPTGWSTMGALREGDLVFDEAGRPCRVIKAHEVLTDRECYRLSFDDGATIVADAGHLWFTEMRRSSGNGSGAAMRGVPRDQRGAWRKGIRTTAEIAATLRYSNGARQSANHSVPLSAPLDLPAAELPVDPYVLGASLCGSGRKHIPAAYLRASLAQRQDLLQGLMDSDGTVAVGGQCSFCNTSERLARDVLELALSLGLKATLVKKTATINRRVVGASWHVNFYAPSGFSVFGLDRKQSRVAPRHTRRRLSGERRIVGCERIESVPVRCISVDSPSQMFLAGREMIPTHNSPVMAGVGLLMMGWHGIPRAEAYAIGQDRATANVLFKDAVAMCRANIPDAEEGFEDSLVSRGEVVIRGEGDNAWKIEHQASGSKFQALANGEAISGPRPVFVAADEIHEFKTNTSIETWQRAIAKMPGDALMLLGTNTPAATQIVGNSYSEFFQKVATGEVKDDEAFAYIARVDKADRETVFDNPKCWVKALPALGITFPEENVQGEVNTARLLLSTAMSVKRLYFGIPTGSVDFWIDENAWAEVQGEVDPAEFKGCPCWLSLDLSQKNDLTALTAVWLKDGRLYAKTWYWTTSEGLASRASRDGAPYEEWVADPDIDLTAVPGAVIDKTFVAAEVAGLCAEHDVQFLAFDPAGIADFIGSCDEIGFPVWRYMGPDKPEGVGLKLVAHAQGTRVLFEDRQLCMPRSVERLEDAILNKTLTVDNSPVTYMCAGNAMLVVDGQKNRAFDKKRSRGRIDGLVTLAMGVGATMMNEASAGPSYLEDNEILIF